MDETWTLPDLVAAAAARIAALPAPKNGQVRAVPDERTIRYYATLGLLDRPLAMRGRTALYGPRHLAQVVAIKRLQSAGRSLAEIQQLWPSLDDDSLARMTGIGISAQPRAARATFWKREDRLPTTDYRLRPEPESEPVPPAVGSRQSAVGPASAVLLKIDLAPGATLLISGLPTPTAADVRAIRAAAEPLVAELAKRGNLEEP